MKSLLVLLFLVLLVVVGFGGAITMSLLVLHLLIVQNAWVQRTNDDKMISPVEPRFGPVQGTENGSETTQRTNGYCQNGYE